MPSVLLHGRVSAPSTKPAKSFNSIDWMTWLMWFIQLSHGPFHAPLFSPFILHSSISNPLTPNPQTYQAQLEQPKQNFRRIKPAVTCRKTAGIDHLRSLSELRPHREPRLRADTQAHRLCSLRWQRKHLRGLKSWLLDLRDKKGKEMEQELFWLVLKSLFWWKTIARMSKKISQPCRIMKSHT